MSDETTTAPTPGNVEPWERMLEDASTMDVELREAGWDTVYLEPESVSPVDTDDRVGLRATVSRNEYDAVESHLGRPEVTFTAVDVYRQTEGQTTVVLAVERDDESGTAVLVPLYYDRPDADSVFETALAEGRLSVYVETDAADTWAVFSHDDPSLFIEAPEEIDADAAVDPAEEAARARTGDTEPETADRTESELAVDDAEAELDTDDADATNEIADDAEAPGEPADEAE